MLRSLRRLFRQFLNKSRTLNHEPLNKVSLVVIILVDLFILSQVFMGLADISSWHLSPNQAYPCYTEWSDYRIQKTGDRDYSTIRRAITDDLFPNKNFREVYQRVEPGHLGQVSPICLDYAVLKDKIRTKENQQLIKAIDQKQTKIDQITQKNNQIRAQYDSTLLEKIAGQSRDRSINAVAAEEAQQTLAQNNRTITDLKSEIQTLKTNLGSKVQQIGLFDRLRAENPFTQLEKGYQQATFWYPSIQLSLQALFLLPLLALAFFVHSFATRKGYGLVALISWHLLVIFLIPLIIKIFEFLQVGVIFKGIFDLVSKLLGGLLFLVSYVYILLIPLLGFGLIKFFQRFVFNSKLQAANRVQKSLCVNCARKIRLLDNYCPHCGYYQHHECANCHSLTYKHLSYCKECGHSQERTDSRAG
jgi:hypothetical protein